MTRAIAIPTGVALAALAGLLTAGPASAQGWQPDQPRTVQWYATHPSERERTRRACLNDPGHLEQTPDCINAKRGELEATAQANRSRTSGGGGFLGPMSPEYWAAHPDERALQLAYCRRMTPEHQAEAGCGPVFQSLGTGAGARGR